MPHPSTFLLALPDSALIAISDNLFPGAGTDSFRAINSLETTNVAIFASHCLDFINFSICCTRLTELYRSHVTSLVLRQRATPPSRAWEIFPATFSLQLDLGVPYKISQKRSKKESATADADASWLCAIVRPAVRSLSLKGVVLRVETFRHLVETCSALEALTLLGCRLLSALLVAPIS